MATFFGLFGWPANNWFIAVLNWSADIKDNMNRHNIKRFLTGLAFLIFCTAHSQSKIQISNTNGKIISIKNENFIGLMTKDETVKYKEDGNLSYRLYKISKDTLVLRKPAIYRDSIIDFTGKSGSYLKANWIFTENLSKEGKVLYKVAMVERYNYKTFAIAEITSLQFPPKIDQKRVGCVFCIFIPIYNLFYIAESKQYHLPKSYSMKKWQLATEQ